MGVGEIAESFVVGLGLFFLMGGAWLIYTRIRPGVSGQFQESLDSLWEGLSASLSLSQIASDLGTVIAVSVVILGLAVYLRTTTPGR
ncbi:MAG: hypothetical protein V5A33_05790 [Halobacteriales archaeon]